MAYPHVVAASVEGFVQQLAVSVVARGHWFYVTGTIPPRKDPLAVDEKLIERYELDRSKWARSRLRRSGYASVRYLRFNRFFVLAATAGRHPFFSAEPWFRDVRERSISFAGYCIGCSRGSDGRWHASVRVHPREYGIWRRILAEHCLDEPTHGLEECFQRFPFEPYAPVRRQLFNLLRAVNRRRHAAGLDPLPAAVIRLRRRVVKPFLPDVHPLSLLEADGRQ